MIVVRASFLSRACYFSINTLACTGIFLVLISTPAHAIIAKAIYPGALPVLAGIEKVREDLKLTSLQEAVLDSIRNEYRSEAQQVYAVTNFKDPASRTHADNAIRHLQLKYNRRVLSTLNKAQRKHLKHIQVQILEGFLLFRKSVQQCLLINSTQRTKIAKIKAKNLKTLQRLNRLAFQEKITPLQRIAALHATRMHSSAELLQVLTPTQRNQLAAWVSKGPPLLPLAD